MFTVKQGVSVHANERTLDRAIAVAQEWIKSIENPSTFTVEDGDGYVVASETNQRIIGTFRKQVWIRDWANHVEDEQFDATDVVLAMPLEKLHALVNNDTSTDDIGRAHVSWDGPFEVDIIDPICEFFGVEAVSDITQANLDHVRTRHVPAVKVKKTVLLMIRVSVDTTDGEDLADFVSEMDYSVKSKLMGTKVRSTEVEDFCVVA